MRYLNLKTKASVEYEHIIIHGLPRERGRDYGKQCAAKIRKNVEHYLQPGELPPWNRVVKYVNNIYIPGLKQYAPAVLEEMKGIAEGAGISLEEVVMVNARYDLSRAEGGSHHRSAMNEDSREEDYYTDFNECTSSAFMPSATKAGNVITAQNWDIGSYLYYDDLIILLEIHPDPSENIPSMFVITEAGQMGRSGMNSAGLGLTANALNSTTDFFPENDDTPRLPIAILRRLFLHSKSYPQALQAVYNAPRHVSNNLTLSTAEGFAMCLEITPHEAFHLPLPVGANHIIHSNHFLNPAMAARPDIHDKYPGGSSWYRNVRLEAGVAPYLDSGVDVEVLKTAFSDHLGHPQSLCQHVDTTPGSGLPGYPFKASMTVACIMYDLTRKVVTVCKGQPCEGIFVSYKLNA